MNKRIGNIFKGDKPLYDQYRGSLLGFQRTDV